MDNHANTTKNGANIQVKVKLFLIKFLKIIKINIAIGKRGNAKITPPRNKKGASTCVIGKKTRFPINKPMKYDAIK